MRDPRVAAACFAVVVTTVASHLAAPLRAATAAWRGTGRVSRD